MEPLNQGVKMKAYETVGCCGIDCGLCPRFHTDGDSACPGCGGLDFKEKHPSCSILTCCAIKKGFGVCSDCDDYPCRRFDSENEGYDSFVTHQKMFANLNAIKNNGLNQFIDKQRIRIGILEDLLTHYNDGRSKGFFCLASALLPLDELQKLLPAMKKTDPATDLREKNRLIKRSINGLASRCGIELKLRKK